MKKKIIAILTAIVLGASMFALAGCTLLSGLFAEGDGSSPYDAAVSRGEEGSLDSWLSSLDTPTTELRRAYEEAKADGSFTGTYFEFLQALGVSDTNGAYVQTALLSTVSIYTHFNENRAEGFSYAGSGIIYSLDKTEGDALIVTNYHVVYSKDSNGRESVSHISDEITIYLYGGEIASAAIPATFLGGAMEYDIAVLSVEDCPLLKETADNPVYAQPVVAVDSDCITLGERVYAIGNPEGTGMSVTEGVVSVDAEYITLYAADERTVISLLEIRTDAAVNHGNSGGGLYNASGNLVGIVNARSEEEGVVAFGYAIPANLALSVAQNIIDTCVANKGAHGAVVARLGITAEVQGSRAAYDPVTGKVYIEQSVVVKTIESESAAGNSALRSGDTLLFAKLTSSRGGVPYEREVAITRLHKLTNLLIEVRRGDTLELTVSRGGELQTITISYENNNYFKYMN